MKLWEVIQIIPYEGDISFGFFENESDAWEAREMLIKNKTARKDELDVVECLPQTLEQFTEDWIKE